MGSDRKINVLFRLDASASVGQGHLARCLILAEMLHGYSDNIIFFCRSLNRSLRGLIRRHGFKVVEIVRGMQKVSQSMDGKYCALLTKRKSFRFDFGIVDHYGLDQAWEKKMRPHIDKLIVIDDLANRIHDCDLLLDANPYPDRLRRYQGLVPPQARLLLGKEHMLFSENLIRARAYPRRILKVSKHVLFIFSSSLCPEFVCKTVLEFLKKAAAGKAPKVTLISRAVTASHLIPLKAYKNFFFFPHISDMGALLGSVDAAVCGGGRICYELAFMGVPAISFASSESQLAMSSVFAKSGFLKHVGYFNGANGSVLSRKISAELEALLNDGIRRSKMVKAGQAYFKKAGNELVLKKILKTAGFVYGK